MSLFLKPALEDQTLGTSEIFVERVSRETSLNEVFECGSLSHATIIAEFLEPLLLKECGERQVLCCYFGMLYLLVGER